MSLQHVYYMLAREHVHKHTKGKIHYSVLQQFIDILEFNHIKLHFVKAYLVLIHQHRLETGSKTFCSCMEAVLIQPEAG